MKSGLLKTASIVAAGGATAFAAAATYLVAPSRAKKAALSPFLNKKFAHRGLYEKDQSIPENSVPAFRRAVDKGYGIELDIQLTADNYVVVFHDDDLKRACGIDKKVCELTYEELCKCKLFNTNEGIPLFKRVLDIVDGAVPLIVEFKSAGPKNIELAQRAATVLAGYEGAYCIESFDPRIVRYFRKYLPWILRGQLSNPPEHFEGFVGPAAGKILSLGLANFMGRPNFIAYEVGKLPFTVSLSHKLGASNVRWVSHVEGDCEDADFFIFEHYMPK